MSSSRFLNSPTVLSNSSIRLLSASCPVLRLWDVVASGRGKEGVTLDLVSVSQVHRVLVGRRSYARRGFRGDGLPSVIDFDVGI